MPAKRDRRIDPRRKRALTALVLLVLFAGNVGLKVRLYPDHPLHVSDPALRYRYARMIAEGDPVPDVDPKVQAPEGLRVRSLLFLLQDAAIGGTYRIFTSLSPGTSFDVYLKWFLCVFSSLPLLAVFFAARLLFKSTAAGLVGAALYAVAVPGFQRTIGTYLREEFALPILFSSFCLFLASTDALPQGKRAHLWGALSGALMGIALSSWHLSGFFLLVFVVAVAIAGFAKGDLGPVSVPLLYIVGFAAIAGAINEPLRNRWFLLSPPMMIGYSLLVAYGLSRRFHASRKVILASFVLMAAVGLVLVWWLSGSRGEYGHVYALVVSKIRFLLDKPANPSDLSEEARLLWLGPFQSPSLSSFLYGFGALALAAIYPAVVLIKRFARGRASRGQIMLLLMTAAFFGFYVLIRRLEVFAVFFMTTLVASLYPLLSSRFPRVALLLPGLLLAFEAYKAFSYPRPNPLSTALKGLSGPAVESPSIQDPDRGAIFRWIRDVTPGDAVFLSRFAVSPMIVTYGERAAVLQPIFETQGIRDKVMECMSAFYGPEEDLFELCSRYEVDYVLYEANQLLDSGELSDRYMTDHLTIGTDCAAFRMHFEPERLAHFEPVHGTDYFRVFRVGVQGKDAGYRLPYSPQYDPLIFGAHRMGMTVSDSLIARGWETLRSGLSLARQGGTLMESGALADAARSFRMALGLLPRLEHARLALGECYRRMRRYDLAETVYEEMIRLNPGNPVGYLNLAAAHAHGNQPDRALDALENGLGQAPENVDLWLFRARLHRGLGNRKEAAESYEEVLRLAPHRSDVRREMNDLGGGS
jgi:tetratricopeptide (TPR) repeat protein